MSDPLRVAVVGSGHLGAIHARVYAEVAEAQLVAVCDTDTARAAQTAERYGSRVLEDYRELAGKVDAVSVATPTQSHYEISRFFLEHGVPVLVEKPITTTLEEAQDLVRISREQGVTLMVGHVERFNPALKALLDEVRHARFVEAHRLSPYRFRSTDIGVVLDLMIHDIDIILAVTGSEVTEVRAAGCNIITPKHEDIANARLTFANGCVANITASRISQQPMRKIRFFTPEAYVTVDMHKREAYIYRKSEKFKGLDPSTIDVSQIGDPLYWVFHEFIQMEKVQIEEEEPLKAEIRDFLSAVRDHSEPRVPGEHGMRAIKVAFEVLAEMEKNYRAAASGIHQSGEAGSSG